MSKSKIHSISSKDWDQQEVLFAVRKKGSNFYQLAAANGYENPRALYAIFYRTNSPKAQTIVANFLEKPPEEIWPSRYTQKHVA